MKLVKDIFGSVNWKDILVRSLKTFLVSFLVAWSGTNYQLDKGVIFGALCAGGTAVLNLAIGVWKSV